MKNFIKSPILLSAGRFTNLLRTPWAGYDIARNFKNEILPDLKEQRIGESWEFSCDPEFPSLVGDSSLIDLIKEYPEELLSPSLVRKTGPNAEILVKLLNPADPLSLQVHPSDDDPDLKPNECGKPESWLVLDAKPGSGLYLGFSESMSKDKLRQLLLEGDRCKDYLQFVPVKPMDFFDLPAGVPHAIGPGVTLLEPQRILFGKSGKTYRLWDWGRKYDSKGNVDAVNGSPRELHLEAGLKLIDPLHQVGMRFVDSIRRQPTIHSLGEKSHVAKFPDNGFYSVDMVELSEGKMLQLSINDGYGIVVPLMGSMVLKSQEGPEVHVIKGQPLLLPHAALPMAIRVQKKLKFALIVPSSASVHYRSLRED